MVSLRPKYLIDNPPDPKEYRVVNQFDEQYSVMELAKTVQKVGNKKGLSVEVKSKDNPRLESEKNYYKADHEKLKELGFKKTREIDEEIGTMLDDLLRYKDRIEQKKDVIVKNIKWQTN